MSYAKRRFKEIENSIDEARFACESKGEYIRHLLKIIQSTTDTIAEINANYPYDYGWLASDEWFSSDYTC